MSIKLFQHKEEKVSVLQVAGFFLILAGLVCLFIVIFSRPNQPSDFNYKRDGEAIAVLFFVIMMGVALVFPDLLQDRTKGLSTMRIVVYMMVNVICMLFIK